MSKINCIVGGTLIGAGGIYAGMRLTYWCVAHVLRKDGRLDEFVQMFEECKKKMEESR